MIFFFFFGNGFIDDVIVIGWTDSDFRISRALDIYFYLFFIIDKKKIGLDISCKLCWFSSEYTQGMSWCKTMFWILILTLKTPRKPASENVVCLCRLLNIFWKLFKSIFAYRQSVDPDQTAPKQGGAVWSGSTLFAEMTFKITSRWESRRQLLWLAV